MRDDTYEAQFQKDGELIFVATMSGGTPSPYTIMKPGKFAISINARYHNDLIGLLNSISRYFLNSHNPGSLLRYVGENANSYEEAKEMLTNMPITSPCYFILSGIEPHEGVVITRSRTGADDIWPINPDSKLDWVVYQTNYDHWVSPAPEMDNNRAAMTRKFLDQIGRDKMDIKKIMKKVLQIPPVLRESTVFAVAMSAKKSYYKTYRYL